MHLHLQYLKTLRILSRSIIYIDIDECAKVQCRNGGKCTGLIDDYHCNCPRGYEGKLCDVGESTVSFYESFKPSILWFHSKKSMNVFPTLASMEFVHIKLISTTVIALLDTLAQTVRSTLMTVPPVLVRAMQHAMMD